MVNIDSKVHGACLVEEPQIQCPYGWYGVAAGRPPSSRSACAPYLPAYATKEIFCWERSLVAMSWQRR